MSANYSNVSMLDMVFEHRNKAYGAYVLRRDYNKSLKQAMLFILSVLTLFCFGNYISQYLLPKRSPAAFTATVINTTEVGKITPPAQKAKPPVTPPQKAKAIATIANTEKQVVPQSQAPVDSIPTVKDLADVESGLKTNTDASTGLGVTDGTGKDAVLDIAKNVEPAQPVIYGYTEVMPEYPGGEQALLKFVRDNVQYPDMERDNEISGKVTAQFVVNEDGSISDVQILKNPSAGFNSAVKHVVAKLGRFKPGMQAGRAVKVRFILPIAFNLR